MRQKTLAKFRHPSVVRVFRVFNANDTAYIVLEFVRGANMETWLKRIQRRPSQDELDHFLPPLLDALEVVHEAGILHRDIKPANIYIREAERTPVLLDFGAAKYAASTVGDQTATTAAIVSKGYSPHEAYSTDAKMQGPWTDIYGLAATLHRGLTGSAPIESTTRIMQDDYVPLGERSELASRYRPEFLNSIDHALAVMPKDRPQSISVWRKQLYPNLVASKSGSTSRDTASGGAVWQPLSDTPSDATTLYTGGSSRPSQAAISAGRSGPSAASNSSGLRTGDVSSITEATRLAYQRVTKGQSRAVITGWALAAAGTAGLALPLVFNAFGDSEPKVALSQQATAPTQIVRQTPSPRPAPVSGTTMSTEEDPQVRAAMDKFEIEREKSRQRERETQRRKWERQRLALQADIARRRAEEASKLAARRVAERQAQDAKNERTRLAKLAEEKRQREEQQRLAAEKAAAKMAAAEKAAAEKAEAERIAREKAAAEERERQRRAAEKAAEERRVAEKKEQERLAAEKAAAEKAAEERRIAEARRIAEEKKKQRLAAEKKEREARLAAAQAAREQERLRLQRRAEAAERARAEREKAKKEKERKYAALDPAATQQQGSATTTVDRTSQLEKVQSALKDSKCYAGELNGDLSATQEALAKFNSGYKGQAKTIDLASASANEYETWVTWFRSLENKGCELPDQEIVTPTPDKAAPTTTKTRTRLNSKKTYKSKSKSKKKTRTTKKKSRSKSTKRRARSKPSSGSGSSSQSLLRGNR